MAAAFVAARAFGGDTRAHARCTSFPLESSDKYHTTGAGFVVCPPALREHGTSDMEACERDATIQRAWLRRYRPVRRDGPRIRTHPTPHGARTGSRHAR
ncbi:hypothetical protein F01_420644 [Burkholderia cenocepacia]|nr:hypothetical protein F01_420644 [Burkholderia cenocepacia]